MTNAIGILTAVIAAPVISYLTGFVTLWIEDSTVDTVGSTRFKGLPIWFYEQAPGISILSGWHPWRFLWNSIAWLAFFLLIRFAVVTFKKRRCKA